MHTVNLGATALKDLPQESFAHHGPRLVAVTTNTTEAARIPDPPARFVRALATRAFEVVEGLRSIAQLGASISVSAARQLSAQRATMRERRQLYHDSRACTPSPGRMHLCRVNVHSAEATVVLHRGKRAHAVALRLEWAHGRWRAVEVYVM